MQDSPTANYKAFDIEKGETSKATKPKRSCCFPFFRKSKVSSPEINPSDLSNQELYQYFHTTERPKYLGELLARYNQGATGELCFMIALAIINKWEVSGYTSHSDAIKAAKRYIGRGVSEFNDENCQKLNDAPGIVTTAKSLGISLLRATTDNRMKIRP